MAVVFVTEFPDFRRAQGNIPAAVIAPKLAQNNVAITAGSVQSNAFNAKTRTIRVHADAIASVEVGGANPTATATSSRMAAGQTEYYDVSPGDKIAVITNT